MKFIEINLNEKRKYMVFSKIRNLHKEVGQIEFIFIDTKCERVVFKANDLGLMIRRKDFVTLPDNPDGFTRVFEEIELENININCKLLLIDFFDKMEYFVFS